MKKIFRWFIIYLLYVFLWPFFLYKKYGNKDYELTGRTVIVSNHYATLDAFFIFFTFKKKNIRFVTIIDVKKNIISRFLTWLFDCLYIDYDATNIDFFKECIKILNNDGIICIYPEGIINPSKFGVFTFQSSFMYLAEKTKAKILMLYVYPNYKFLKKSVLFIGDELTYDEYSKFDSRQDAVNYVQCKIGEYSLGEYDCLN